MLITRARDRLAAHVLLVHPPGSPPEWSTTNLGRQAALVTGVGVTRDLDGTESRRFGAATSGQVVVYDDAGRLRFSGGITPSRGHEGDNAGRNAILALISRRGPRIATTRVFGCSLFGGGG